MITSLGSDFKQLIPARFDNPPAHFPLKLFNLFKTLKNYCSERGRSAPGGTKYFLAESQNSYHLRKLEENIAAGVIIDSKH